MSRKKKSQIYWCHGKKIIISNVYMIMSKAASRNQLLTCQGPVIILFRQPVDRLSIRPYDYKIGHKSPPKKNNLKIVVCFFFQQVFWIEHCERSKYDDSLKDSCYAVIIYTEKKSCKKRSPKAVENSVESTNSMVLDIKVTIIHRYCSYNFFRIE